MEDLLREKLEQAIGEIVTEAQAEAKRLQESGGNVDVESALDRGIKREARFKAKRIHEFLKEAVFSRLEELEGKVSNLEDRIQGLGSPGPTGGGGTGF